MAITEEKTETVVVADAAVRGTKIRVTVGRDLSVDESRQLRKLLKSAEGSAACTRAHNTFAEALGRMSF